MVIKLTYYLWQQRGLPKSRAVRELALRVSVVLVLALRVSVVLVLALRVRVVLMLALTAGAVPVLVLSEHSSNSENICCVEILSEKRA